jgi:actin related protein 2/3 complex, subunit 1A/1B
MKGEQSNSKLWQSSCISALAFSQDAQYCAVATKQDHIVHLYRVTSLAQVDAWVLLQEFKELTQTVSDIDWSADRKIVTASHDRSVVVWRQVGEARWEKMLVNIDIKLSILVAKWAPSSRKFAMGSACNTLAVSYFNKEENCWVITSKSNLTRAPITTLSFHPSSNLLAIGSADFSVKVVTSSFRNSKDPLIVNSKVEDYQYNGPFKNIDSMYEVLFTVDNLGGWVNHVSFQDNGASLLVLPHSNHFKLYEIAEGTNLIASEEDVQWNGLPFLSGYTNANKELFLGGFNKKVAKFAKKGMPSHS